MQELTHGPARDAYVFDKSKAAAAAAAAAAATAALQSQHLTRYQHVHLGSVDTAQHEEEQESVTASKK
jgi:hypothetical protein